jgi:hypothetical protein
MNAVETVNVMYSHSLGEALEKRPLIGFGPWKHVQPKEELHFRAYQYRRVNKAKLVA